jgi:hypothetical protein
MPWRLPFITAGRLLVPADARRRRRTPERTRFVSPGPASITQPLAGAPGGLTIGPMLAASLALSLLVATGSPTPFRRLAVLVTIDPQAVERYAPVSDVTREIRAIWDPYADLDFAEVAATVTRTYDAQLRLVVDELPSNSPTAESLGWITFTAPGQPADVITVSGGGARNLMAQGRWGDRRLAELTRVHQRQFMTRALARSAAHEIGHYLLRSSAHSRTGLMRDRLTVDIIMDNDRRPLRLEPPQIAMLRRRASVTGFLANSVAHPAGNE